MLFLPHETQLALYRYDPLDHLVEYTLRQQTRIQRFYCRTRLSTEIQGAIQSSIMQHDDQLLAQRQKPEGAEANTALLATDQQRSVLNTLDINQTHSLAYTPYGHRPMENGLLSLLGFNGERPDPTTGHYHLGNGYRQFNPMLMRFNSPDSWSPFGGGGLNAYAYCAGDPRNRKDPTGHSPVRAAMVIAIARAVAAQTKKRPRVSDASRSISKPKASKATGTQPSTSSPTTTTIAARTNTISGTPNPTGANETIAQINRNNPITGAYTSQPSTLDVDSSFRHYQHARNNYPFIPSPVPDLDVPNLNMTPVYNNGTLVVAPFDASIAFFRNGATHSSNSNPHLSRKFSLLADLVVIERAEFIRHHT